MLRKLFTEREEAVLWVKATGHKIKHGDQMEALACYKLTDGQVYFTQEDKDEWQFSRYSQVDRDKISPEAQQNLKAKVVNKIVAAEKFTEHYQDFMDFVKGSKIITFNAPFHLAHIANSISTEAKPIKYDDMKKALKENGCEIVDVLSMAKKVFPNSKHDKKSVCQDLGIVAEMGDCYSAKSDAKLLARMYEVIEPMYRAALKLAVVSKEGLFAKPKAVKRQHEDVAVAAAPVNDDAPRRKSPRKK